MSQLRPAGALAARRAYRKGHVARLLATVVAVAAAVAVVVGGGYAVFHRSSMPLPATESPTPQPGPSTPAATGSLSATGTPSVTDSSTVSGPTPSGSAAVPPVPPTSGGTARCHTGDLSATGIGGDGHAGSGTAYLALTNTSEHDCTLTGFPGLRAVDGNGSALPITVKRTGTATRVMLHPGGMAYTSITTSSIPVPGFDKAPCEPPAAAVWLIPPGESRHLTVGNKWHICGRGVMEVTPMDAVRPVS